MRVAIYGGTYDPIHYGHLRVAEEVRETLGLDRVVFVPAYANPFKEGEAGSPAEVRCELVRAAIEGNPGFEVSDMEISRPETSYTINTVRAFHDLNPGVLDLSLVMGTDSFNDIRMWCDYEDLLAEASIIVVPRPGFAPKKPAEALPVELARKFWYDAESGGYKNSFGTSLTYLSTTIMDISSTDIRERVAADRSIRYLVPPEVERIIAGRGLYGHKAT